MRKTAGAELADLEALYRARYRHFLHVALAVLGDEERAHEAVQDAFAAAIRNRRRYRGDGPLEAWVWRAVVNAARKGARTLAESPLAVTSMSANGVPVEAAAVRGWVAALPERQRLAVFLRYYADLDYRSIAEALNVEVGTVSATLSAAHAALRKALEEVRT